VEVTPNAGGLKGESRPFLVALMPQGPTLSAKFEEMKMETKAEQ
jgi:hypothetical protein